MRTRHRLNVLFASALSAACGTPAGNPILQVSRTGLTADPCGGAASFTPLEGLTSGPGKVADYIEFRTVEPAVDSGTRGYSTETNGVPCAGATNAAVCRAAFARATSDTGFDYVSSTGDGAQFEYYVYTRGDDVGVVDSFDKLVVLLAPVMTVHNAALLASTDPGGGGRKGPVECGMTTGGAVTGGFELVTGGGCGGESRVFVSKSGTDIHATASTSDQCTTGRRPEGLLAEAPSSPSELGGFFAEVAQLEAASVFAFERLARELIAHRAPARLSRAAERSMRDELRHAFVTTHLAERFGARAPEIGIGPMSVRPLFEIALENATEGCVRETFGALVAAYQMQTAKDERVARAMVAIARDEARHAALAWEVAAWAESRLTEAEREETAAVRRRAAKELRLSLDREISANVAREAGIPTRERAVALFDHVAQALWADEIA